MRPSRQHEGRTPRGERPAAAAADRPASAGDGLRSAAAPSFRIVCSAEESLGDGELHVERREGSVSAWYERGRSAAGSRSSARRVPRSELTAGGSLDDVASEAAPLRNSFTVVLHDNRLDEQEIEEESEDDGHGAAAGSQHVGAGRSGDASPEAAAAAGEQEDHDVSWETNNLYDYLKGLQQAELPPEMSSAEWAQRLGSLRQLLRDRDGEVAELQRLLDTRADKLEGQEAELARRAQRIAELEERVAELEGRIRQLARQLEAAQAAAGVSMGPEPSSRSAHIHMHGGLAVQKQKLNVAAAAQAYAPAPADSYFVQLPAQSYAEHQGCGFWQSVVESMQRHPRRTWAAVAALLLLLLIVLCATLVPAARRARQRPAFLEAPVLAAAGASWLDLAVKLDRPSLLYYMAFRQADLNSQVSGTDRTLLQLLQEEDVQARAVYAASAPSGSMDPDAAPQAGLQQLAAACGWVPVPTGSKDGSLPAEKVSVLSVAGSGASACTASNATLAQGHCARCPKLEDGTAYTLLLVAATGSGKGLSGVQVVNAVTGATSLNVNSVQPPFADNVTETSFILHAKLNTAGTLYYAVVLDRLYAPYGASQLAFGQLTPSASAIVSADPSEFLGGLVAVGSVSVSAAGGWANVTVRSPCVGALCTLSLWALQGGTDYRVFLVGVDSFGSPDPAPAVLSVTTAPATSAPALLPATQPANISAAGFGAAVSQDAAGAVYYMLVAPKPATAAAGADVAAGSWSQVAGLVPASSSRRRLAGATDGVLAGADSPYLQLLQQPPSGWHRQLLQAAPSPGSLVAPTCYPANRSCAITPSAAFTGTAGLSGFDVVASGCLPVPAAGQALALPPFTGLANNSLYHLLLASEDSAVPQMHRQQPPTVFAVRTVDLSAPQLACGFPVATNITSSGFSLSAMLTKPGASVFYVVVSTAAAASSRPTAQEVLQGTAAGGATPTAAGNLTQWGALPWEAPAAAGSGDARKLWAAVGGLQSGGNYTVFFTVTADGSTPVSGAPVAVLSGILLPAVVPPTFTQLTGVNASVDEARGTFQVQLSAVLDRPGQVFFALYRNYSCIKGDPSVSDIVAGNALPAGICPCGDAAYCARVTAGSFSVPSQGAAASYAVGGDLSPLPFQSLRNATEDQLKCFQGGLGQATDTYNIYLVAANALPTFTGLAPQCSSFSQAAATAAAASGGTAVDATCPAAPQLACGQSQQRPDVQAMQSGAIVPWASNDSAAAGTNSTILWQQPSGVSVAGRPARVQLSVEGGSAPAFTFGPAFPPAMRTANGFGLQFALDKPALLIYAVFRPMPIDATGDPQAPVLIATGRVPVFDAATNATASNITACSWAPGGAMQEQSQYYVTYVARDKYGRMDGLCPGQTPGSAPRVCTDLAFTGG